jgi:hypothetical protein
VACYLICLRELAESPRLCVHGPDAASNGVTEDFAFRIPISQLGLQGNTRAPSSDTEVSCGLEIELKPHEHGTELDYNPATPEPEAEPSVDAGAAIRNGAPVEAEAAVEAELPAKAEGAIEDRAPAEFPRSAAELSLITSKDKRKV